MLTKLYLLNITVHLITVITIILWDIYLKKNYLKKIFTNIIYSSKGNAVFSAAITPYGAHVIKYFFYLLFIIIIFWIERIQKKKNWIYFKYQSYNLYESKYNFRIDYINAENYIFWFTS